MSIFITGIVVDYQDANGAPYHSEHRTLSAGGTMYQQPALQPQQYSQNCSNFQRVEFGRANNSAFIPIKDGVNVPPNDLNIEHNSYASKTVELEQLPLPQTDTDDLEINELLEIIGSPAAPQPHTLVENGSQATAAIGVDERIRSISVSDNFVHNQ